MPARILVALCLAVLLAWACAPRLKLFTDSADPLQEFVLEGKAADKVLLLPVQGFIWDEPRQGLLRSRPSVVQEVVSQLKLAEKDERIKAVVLSIDSPGGTSTASDLLHHELSAFKARTGKKLVAAFMGLAASGGYYAALSADAIVACPTTVTGSVGVVFFRPRVVGLMDKVGVEVEVSKSGRNKDMGSPLRTPTDEERALMASMIKGLADRFLSLVKERRRIEGPALETVATARVFSAEEALGLGLIDRIGYLEDAVARARDLAGLPADARLVVYRRQAYPNDTTYNTLTEADPARPALISLDAGWLLPPRPGFYYVWPAAVGE